MFYSDNCFSFTSTLADAMRSMDVSRSPDPDTLHPCFLYHVPPARVLVRFLSHFMCFPYLYQCSSSTRYQLLVYSPFSFLARRLVCLRFSLMSLSFRLVDSSPISLFMDSDSSPSHFPFLYCCTCISHTTIYTGWRCGLVPHLQSTLQPP